MSRYKPEGALLSIAVMLAGLLGSRALGSIGIIIFGANALRGVQPKEWLKQRWWLLGLGWLLLFAGSYFWSANKHEWSVLAQVKLPFLLLPLAFGLLPSFSQRHLNVFTILLFGWMLSGCCWSMVKLLHDPGFYINGYGFSHLIPTPAYGDHIAFSTMIAFCVAWGAYQWPQWRGYRRWAGLLIVGVFIIYLHILAAKTGLISLYVFAAAYLITLLMAGNWRKALLALCGVAVIIGVAFATIPTFRTRFYYIKYATEQYRDGNRSGEYGDISRVISYRIAGHIIAKNAVIGVGAGDMLDDMKRGYDRWAPQVRDENRLLPHNEFLTLALGAGVGCAILFVIWIVAPLWTLRRRRGGAFFIQVWLLLLVPLLVDPFLEVQWGVLVYVLPLLFVHKVVRDGQVARPDVETGKAQ